MRILLIRHGPSAHSLPAWLPLNHSALERWRSDYDAAGILEDASASWCEQACRARATSSVVAVVTHGVFRRELARALKARGWKISGRRSYAPWSIWELVGQSA